MLSLFCVACIASVSAAPPANSDGLREEEFSFGDSTEDFGTMGIMVMHEEKEPEADEVCMEPDVTAIFPHNEQKDFRYWVMGRVVYPAIALQNEIEGRVFISFVIERDGSLGDLKLVRGVDPSVDKAALDAVADSPKWIPGKVNGKPVRTKFTLPVDFRIR